MVMGRVALHILAHIHFKNCEQWSKPKRLTFFIRIQRENATYVTHTGVFIRLPSLERCSSVVNESALVSARNTKTQKVIFHNHGRFLRTIEFASVSILMEFGIDGPINGETVGNDTIGHINSSTVDENKVGCSSHNPAYKQDHDDNITLDSSGDDTIPSGIPAVSIVSADEPYVGQEFESEAAAHAFYNAYATRVGFIIRVSKLSRSRRDGTAIGRALVCNREGYRMPDKREKIVRQRAETRVGCRAMILVRKVSSGKWVVTKFISEHTHPLTPGKGRRDCIYEQYPNEHDKIRELSQQLALEKKRSATYKRHLELIFEHIEEHNDSLSKKIQYIVDSVKEMETKEEQSHR